MRYKKRAGNKRGDAKGRKRTGLFVFAENLRRGSGKERMGIKTE